ncbi:uncharacterized protein LOC118199302, partial [Stegodyphus dumicola]|uniref:uncharacterized protein LOC118199302 n=1 Tax=Stegodyphus dumicola TaxID=202533 RepID=UPI0015AF4FE5
LAWIKKDKNWSVSVRNRVKEIRELSKPSAWKHVPGERNPTDLPSRGYKAKYLITSRWWEGPHWINDPTEFLNYMDSCNHHSRDEEEIEREKLKTTSTMTNYETVCNNNWYYRHFSNYERIVRMVSWILRFKHNCTNIESRKYVKLNATEFRQAELKILHMIQKESLDLEHDRLKTLQVFKDDRSIYRVKTKIIYRKGSEYFLKPVVLSSKHEVVKRLIFSVHVKNCHAGGQILLNLLREKYWILNGRKTVKNIVANYTICKRYNSRNMETICAPLPENRVKDAAVFQITGVDVAGPLFLKESRKSWVLIFTCAVYRAVHFELITAASTDAFLMAFRRFIARRGRCTVVYCDN